MISRFFSEHMLKTETVSGGNISVTHTRGFVHVSTYFLFRHPTSTSLKRESGVLLCKESVHEKNNNVLIVLEDSLSIARNPV